MSRNNSAYPGNHSNNGKCTEKYFIIATWGILYCVDYENHERLLLLLLFAFSSISFLDEEWLDDVMLTKMKSFWPKYERKIILDSSACRLNQRFLVFFFSSYETIFFLSIEEKLCIRSIEAVMKNLNWIKWKAEYENLMCFFIHSLCRYVRVSQIWCCSRT